MAAALWEVAARSSWLSAALFPAPAAILTALWRAGSSGELLSCLLPTAVRVAAGFVLGAAGGLAVGTACGLSPAADAVLDPWINATYPLPKVALIPMFMFLLGVNERLSLAVVALSAAYPVAVAARMGVRRTDDSLVDAAVNLGAGPFDVAREVVLPSMLPFLLVGFRLGALKAVQASIVAEMLLSFPGLGRMAWISGEWLRMETYYAYLLVIGAAGWFMVWLLRVSAKKFVPWAEHEDLQA